MEVKEMDFGDVSKEPTDVGRETMVLEGALNSPILTQPKEVHTEVTYSPHNKPKKANKKVVPQGKFHSSYHPFHLDLIFSCVTNLSHRCIIIDYVCTPQDIAAINLIMAAPKKTKFVDIDDAFLSNDELACLTRNDGFLHDDVSQ